MWAGRRFTYVFTIFIDSVIDDVSFLNQHNKDCMRSCAQEIWMHDGKQFLKMAVAEKYFSALNCQFNARLTTLLSVSAIKIIDR